jgi:hypothetical protein
MMDHSLLIGRVQFSPIASLFAQYEEKIRGHCWWRGCRDGNRSRSAIPIFADLTLTFLADTLAAHPERFKVTIVERMPVTGGQATSISLDQAKYGTAWMNDGVQGGSPVILFNPKKKISTDQDLSDIQTHIQFFPEVWPQTPGSQAAGCLWQGSRWVLDQLLPKQVDRRVFRRHQEIWPGP